MHKPISTTQWMVDREITLKNVKTGTIDRCFDHSDFPEDKYPGFYFMEIGGQYECKIVLFGSPVSEEGKHTVRCRVLDPDVILEIAVLSRSAWEKTFTMCTISG